MRLYYPFTLTQGFFGNKPYAPMASSILTRNDPSTYAQNAQLAQCASVHIHSFNAKIVKEAHNQHDFCFGHRGIAMILSLTICFSVYSAIIASKSLQKWTAIQNISVTLSLAITVFSSIILCFSEQQRHNKFH